MRLKTIKKYFKASMKLWPKNCWDSAYSMWVNWLNYTTIAVFKKTELKAETIWRMKVRPIMLLSFHLWYAANFLLSLILTFVSSVSFSLKRLQILNQKKQVINYNIKLIKVVKTKALLGIIFCGLHYRVSHFTLASLSNCSTKSMRELQESL